MSTLGCRITCVCDEPHLSYGLHLCRRGGEALPVGSSLSSQWKVIESVFTLPMLLEDLAFGMSSTGARLSPRHPDAFKVFGDSYLTEEIPDCTSSVRDSAGRFLATCAFCYLSLKLRSDQFSEVKHVVGVNIRSFI